MWMCREEETANIEEYMSNKIAAQLEHQPIRTPPLSASVRSNDPRKFLFFNIIAVDQIDLPKP